MVFGVLFCTKSRKLNNVVTIVFNISKVVVIFPEGPKIIFALFDDNKTKSAVKSSSLFFKV